jgi:MFS family permease
MTPDPIHPGSRNRTLILCAVLHAFTHAYNVALLPLYLPMREGLNLPSVESATILVTVMMVAYFLPSYPLGVLADRFSRKRLLTLGLLINALGFIGLAFAPNYPVALACVVVAGLGGSFYHPAATGLIARLFPENTGRALGLAGVGASVGFFFGPLYCGWRAETAGWRAPVLELGLLGLAAALAFAWLAREESDRGCHVLRARTPVFPSTLLWTFFLAAALFFSLRDFAGSTMGTLGSLFLQEARGFNLHQTGFALSALFIASAISNPLFGGLSDRGRNRWLLFVLLTAALVIAAFPRLPRAWLVPALMAYGFFFLSSYPMVEAALMQAVPDAVRGRVFGLFITIGGFLGNLAHWRAGNWVRDLGSRASDPVAYYHHYLYLALLVLLSLLGLPFLRALRRRESLIPSAPPPTPTT